MTALKVHDADISHHQGSVNLDTAKKAGLGSLCHKATQGTGFVDDRYVERRDKARKIGLPFSAYHFAETHGTPEAQAAHFLKVAGIKPGDMRPRLDLEDDATNDSFFSRMTVVARTAWVVRWVRAVKKATGVDPFIYTPFALGRVPEVLACPLWVARYNDDNRAPRIPAPWSTYTLWQFTNGVSGNPKSFPGLGHCDLSTWNATSPNTPARMRQVFTIPKPAVPKPPPVEPTPTPPKPPTPPTSGGSGKPLVFNVLLAPGRSTPDMARTSVQSDGKTAGKMVGTRAVVGITEATKSDTKDFGAGLPKGFQVRNGTIECPVWLGPEWVVESATKVLLHKSFLAENPKSKISGVSPARYLSVVKARHKATGKRCAFVFTHFVSKANNKTQEKGEEWRREKWDQSWPILLKTVQGLVGEDLPVVVAGDFNTGVRKTGNSLTKTLPSGTVHAYNSTLDHVWIVPSKSTKVKAGHVATRKGKSDHPMALVPVTLR